MQGRKATLASEGGGWPFCPLHKSLMMTQMHLDRPIVIRHQLTNVDR